MTYRIGVYVCMCSQPLGTPELPGGADDFILLFLLKENRVKGGVAVLICSARDHGDVVNYLASL